MTSEKVAVSSAQRRVAQAMVRRSAASGRYVSESVHKIANAKTVPARAPRASSGKG